LPRKPASPDVITRWLTFLRNHRGAIAAMDFFVVPTVTFRLLCVWFAIDHARRRILHSTRLINQQQRGSSSSSAKLSGST
jgi:hypothetical protein